MVPGVPTHLLVRTVHVLAMAGLVGGAGLVWLLGRHEDGSTLAIARSYEWLFWGGLGVLIVTGVGNLGAFGRGLPGPATTWGTVLSVKLGLVLVLLLGSAIRTLAVARAQSVNSPAHHRLHWSYAATTAVLLVIVALAEVLAHG